jgi:ferric-dicitrate binding protein FerR (iron transport regulator)
MILHPKTKTLIRYIDKDLPGARVGKIRQHLDRCDRCKKRYSILQRIEEVNAPKKELPSDLRDRIVANLKEVRRVEQPICATITATIGKVLIFQAGVGDGIEGFPGMGLKKADTVRMLGDSRALVELNDGSSIYLNKDTEINLSSARYNIAMMVGEIFAMMKPQKKTFEICTPSAILGIIGTDFDAKVTEQKKTIVQVLKGRVSFQNDAGKTIVKKKRQVEASKYAKPIPNKIKDSSSISNWAKPLRQINHKNSGWIVKKMGLIILILLIITGIILKWQIQRSHSYSLTFERFLAFFKTQPSAAEIEKLKEFVSLYSLSPDQVVKFIPQPFPEGRMIYHRYEALQRGAQPSKGPSNMFFHWSENNELKDYGFYNGGETGHRLKNILHAIANLWDFEMQGDEAALNMIIKGDFIMRENASAEQRVEHFVKALQKHIDLPYRMEFRILPHPVIVMRGKFQLKLLPGKDKILIYGDHSEPRQWWEGQDEANFNEFVEALKLYLGRYIINEVETLPTQKLSWQEIDTPGDEKEIQLVLQNLTAQTGLTFTEETRPVRILYVEHTDSTKQTSSNDKQVIRTEISAAKQGEILEEYRKIQETFNFRKSPFAGVCSIIDKAKNSKDLAERIIAVSPRFLQSALYEQLKKEGYFDVAVENKEKTQKRKENFSSFFAFKIEHIDMEDTPTDNSVAFVYFKKLGEQKTEVLFFLYEDGVWKLALMEPRQNKEQFAELGLIIKNYHLVDYSKFMEISKGTQRSVVTTSEKPCIQLAIQVKNITSYTMNKIPYRLLVTTAEGNRFEVRIISEEEHKGINLEYDKIEGTTPGAKLKRVFLPDADLKDKNTLLDLASGELLKVNFPAESDIFPEFDKGDLMYDIGLICVRGAKAQPWEGAAPVPGLIADVGKRYNDWCGYWLPENEQIMKDKYLRIELDTNGLPILELHGSEFDQMGGIRFFAVQVDSDFGLRYDFLADNVRIKLNGSAQKLEIGDITTGPRGERVKGKGLIFRQATPAEIKAFEEKPHADTFGEANLKATASRVKADMRSMAMALEAYFVDTNHFPAWVYGDHPYAFNKNELNRTMPSFRLGVTKGKFYLPATLTTPIAYMTRYLTDPFQPSTTDSKPTFAYYADRNGWIMVSPGTDADYDINPIKDYHSDMPQPGERLILKAYDPTNGTVSDGDIFRVHQ